MKEVPNSYVISSTNVACLNAYVARAAGEHAVQGHKEKSDNLICLIRKIKLLMSLILNIKLINKLSEFPAAWKAIRSKELH